MFCLRVAMIGLVVAVVGCKPGTQDSALKDAAPSGEQLDAPGIPTEGTFAVEARKNISRVNEKDLSYPTLANPGTPGKWTNFQRMRFGQVWVPDAGEWVKDDKGNETRTTVWRLYDFSATEVLLVDASNFKVAKRRRGTLYYEEMKQETATDTIDASEYHKEQFRKAEPKRPAAEPNIFKISSSIVDASKSGAPKGWGTFILTQVFKGAAENNEIARGMFSGKSILVKDFPAPETSSPAPAQPGPAPVAPSSDANKVENDLCSQGGIAAARDTKLYGANQTNCQIHAESRGKGGKFAETFCELLYERVKTNSPAPRKDICISYCVTWLSACCAGERKDECVAAPVAPPAPPQAPESPDAGEEERPATEE